MPLYIVSTPIGNNKDITLRALETLQQANAILCEDTRHSGLLLHNLEIKKPLISFHEHNEISKLPEIINRLSSGESLALISDAGTPLISDPGFKLVRAASEAKIPVIAIPGPVAAMAALTTSGLPTDKFLFVGYLPKTSGKKEQVLENLTSIYRILPLTLIFYESPHRIHKTLASLVTYFPESQVSLAREITKIHEEIINGPIKEVVEKIAKRSLKGEITLTLH